MTFTRWSSQPGYTALPGAYIASYLASHPGLKATLEVSRLATLECILAWRLPWKLASTLFFKQPWRLAIQQANQQARQQGCRSTISKSLVLCPKKLQACL